MKKDVLVQRPLAIKKSLIHGYGVFAQADIAPDEIIEECHAILTYGGDPVLRDYYYSAGRYFAVPTGFGLIYNHATDPNATYHFDEESELLTFKALRPIKKEEEIVVYYGHDWFAERKMEVKRISWLRRLYIFVMRMPLRVLVVCGGLYLVMLLLDYLRATHLQ